MVCVSMPAIDVEFHDERNSMHYWYSKVAPLAVPMPETEFFSLGDMGDGTFDVFDSAGVDVERLLSLMQNIPVKEIAAVVETLPSDTAHIRSDYKASRMAGGEGREITADHKHIHEQVLQLIDSMLMMGFPKRSLAVREWIDVQSYGDSYMSSIVPEVRFIVDEGEVLGGFVDVYEDDFDSSFTPEEREEILQDITASFEADYDQLETYAKRVAEAVDETGWSVDFIQDTAGDWYLTDMGLYGLYWNEAKDRWHNISHIPSGKPYNLEENLPETLPDDPEFSYDP